MRGRHAVAGELLGAEEVRQLVGAAPLMGGWQSILGSEAQVMNRGHRGGFGAGRNFAPSFAQREGFNHENWRAPGSRPPGLGGGFPGEHRREERHEEHEIRREEWEASHPGEHWEERERRRLEWERHHPGQHFVGASALMGADALMGAWQSIVGHEAVEHAMGLRPRNMLIQDPPPTQARREILPMSSGTVTVGPTQSLQITSRPQRPAFRPERVVISGQSTAGGAADWIVNDITIGNRSQFTQSGSVPGDMFASTAIDTFVSFETVQTAMDVVMIVTYVGSTESIAFVGSITGTSAVGY